MAKNMNSEAKTFLEKIGLGEFVETIVIKQRLTTLKDLLMLTKESNEVLQFLKLPLGVVFKVRQHLLSEGILCSSDGPKPHASESPKPCSSTSSSEPPVKASCSSLKKEEKTVKEMTEELSKTRLLELCKEHVSAQLANQALNEFHNNLNRLLNEYWAAGKWKGQGGLKECSKTTKEESEVNRIIASEILNSECMKTLYGIYKVEGHGCVTLTRAKASGLLGKKNSQKTKPSAYLNKKENNEGARSMRKRKASKDSSTVPTKRTSASTASNSTKNCVSANVPTTSNSTKDCAAANVPESELSGDEQNEDSDSSKEEESEYERQCQKRRQENAAKQLELGLLSSAQAQTVGQCYIGIPKMMQIAMPKARSTAVSVGLALPKGTKKLDIIEEIGKLVYRKELVVMKDPAKGIAYSNLAVQKKD